ncbi:MAG: trypsin-like peptidase domain-containing protein [Treponema sp.]|nr:trypsin-like peptidase domain-containing protein [Treponema sp.]
MKKYGIILAGFFLSVSLWAQTILSPTVLDKVLASTFEVVVEKPTEDAVSYERSLPLERIPFSIRNDAYLPIGTAFLMDDGQFYSAAHVFTLYQRTMYSDYYIRDRHGKTYKVSDVTHFSTNRDFISFTVNGYKKEAQAGLSAGDMAPLNSQVFSVGNALGDGIVIRNGVFTSQTHEEQNGEWQWLRFSAAASPGNSGGPLITADGLVIGIVTMKSENENLNYALPFSEIASTPNHTGRTRFPFYYSLPNILSDKFYRVFESELKLPMPLKSVQQKVTAEFDAFVAGVVNDIKKDYAPTGKNGFAVTNGKAEMLIDYTLATFPYTMYVDKSGKWGFARPSEKKDHPIDGNGNVSFGVMMNRYFATIEKPTTVPLAEFVSNAKQYMDYMFEAVHFTRNVTGERIAITSLGEPCRSESYVDYFGRTWLVNYWNLQFVDQMLISYVLPLPDGLYLMLDIDSTGTILNSGALDLAFIADFAIPTYNGTYAQWLEFLALPESLRGTRPDYLKAVSFTTDKTHTIFSTQKFSLDVPTDIFALDDETCFCMGTGFELADGAVIMDNSVTCVYSPAYSENYHYVCVVDIKKPESSALKQTMQNWQQKINRETPYNAEPYVQKQYTYVDKIIYPSGITYETREKADSVYLLSLEVKGQNKTDEVTAFAAQMEAGLSIKKR